MSEGVKLLRRLKRELGGAIDLAADVVDVFTRERPEGTEVLPACPTCNDRRRIGAPGHEVDCPRCVRVRP